MEWKKKEEKKKIDRIWLIAEMDGREIRCKDDYNMHCHLEQRSLKFFFFLF